MADVSTVNYYEALNWPIRDFIEYSNNNLHQSQREILQQRFKENFMLRAHYLQCEQSFRENDITTVGEWDEFIVSELHDKSDLTKAQREDFQQIHRRELLSRLKVKNKF